MRLLSFFLLWFVAGCTERSTEPATQFRKNEPEVQTGKSANTAAIISDTFLINYNHGDGEAAISASASNLDGVYRLTITRNRIDNAIEIKDERFRSLWDGVIDIPDIADNAVSNPNAPLDFRNHHIIGIVFSTGGQQGTQTYSVPSEGRSEKFLQWVQAMTEP